MDILDSDSICSSYRGAMSAFVMRGRRFFSSGVGGEYIYIYRVLNRKTEFLLPKAVLDDIGQLRGAPPAPPPVEWKKRHDESIS